MAVRKVVHPTQSDHVEKLLVPVVRYVTREVPQCLFSVCRGGGADEERTTKSIHSKHARCASRRYHVPAGVLRLEIKRFMTGSYRDIDLVVVNTSDFGVKMTDSTSLIAFYVFFRMILGSQKHYCSQNMVNARTSSDPVPDSSTRRSWET